MKYCIFYTPETSIYETFICETNDINVAIKIAKETEDYMNKDKFIFFVHCYECDDNIHFDKGAEYDDWDFLHYNKVYPIESNEDLFGQDYPPMYCTPRYVKCKLNPKYNLDLMEVIESLTIESMKKYGSQIKNAIEQIIDSLDDEILSKDNPSEKLEASFDDLCEIDDNIEDLLCDIDHEKDDETVDDINKRLTWIKESIILYQSNYKKLKNIKI